MLVLNASASVEVANDVLGVTLAATRDGPDAAVVQSALKQALDAALAEARKAARPNGQLEVRTGNFSLFPRYTNKGQISGWQGTAELLVEGQDLPAITQLTGRINALPGGLTIARVGYRHVEGAAREGRGRRDGAGHRALPRPRRRLREAVRLRRLRDPRGQRVEQRATRFRTACRCAPRRWPPSADEALPVEPGKGTVSVTVSGSVQMK